MQQALESLLRKRKDRSIAIILGVKERDCDRHLPPQVQKQLRKVILDQFNDFYSLIIDVAASLDNGEVVLNDEYLGKIDAMYDELTALRAGLTDDGMIPIPPGRPLTRSG